MSSRQIEADLTGLYPEHNNGKCAKTSVKFSEQTAGSLSSGCWADFPAGEMHRSPWALFVCVKCMMVVWETGEAPFPGA